MLGLATICGGITRIFERAAATTAEKSTGVTDVLRRSTITPNAERFIKPIDIFYRMRSFKYKTLFVDTFIVILHR